MNNGIPGLTDREEPLAPAGNGAETASSEIGTADTRKVPVEVAEQLRWTRCRRKTELRRSLLYLTVSYHRVMGSLVLLIYGQDHDPSARR
jgi:hypothetical protein